MTYRSRHNSIVTVGMVKMLSMYGRDRTVTIVNVDKTGRPVSWSMLGQSKQVYMVKLDRAIV